MTTRSTSALLVVCAVMLTALLVAPGVAGSARPSSRETAVEASPASARTLVAVDVAPAAGISSARTRTWSAAPFDFDRDGDQDVLVGYHPVERLWRNEGDGSYQRVAREAWPANATDRHNCAWADVDRNGLADVMCSAGRGLANRVKHSGIDNELWLQTAPEQFVEVGTEWGIGDPCGRGRDVAFIDANGDRFPDLFVGNMTPRDVADECDGSPIYPNERSKLYLNREGEAYVHAPRLWPYGGGAGTRCIERLDYNGDGWDDLFACRSVEQTPRLYRNKRGSGFVDVTPQHAFSAPISDAHVRGSGDGFPDLVTAGPRGFAHHVNRAGRFATVRLLFTPPSGVGMAVASADADGDGDQDVYAMVGNGRSGNPDDRILLNRPRSLRVVRVPGAAGAADDVVVLRRLADGRAEFLALNGYNLDGVGPVQLIRLERRTSEAGD